jgi:DNA replication and repair protein RecF
VALVGPNGAGKTNILEAVSFLTAGRGLRRATLSDVAGRDGDGSWSVAATVQLDDMETRSAPALPPAAPDARCGSTARTCAARRAFSTTCACSGWFRRWTGCSPARIGPAAFPRPADSGDRPRARPPGVSDFENALRQRNRLLDQGGSDAYLTALEQQVAELGTAVSIARSETVGLLKRMIDGQALQDTPFPHAMSPWKALSRPRPSESSASDREDAYRRMLRDGRGRDRAAGRTLSGPHLSDLRVRMRPRRCRPDSLRPENRRRSSSGWFSPTRN